MKTLSMYGYATESPRSWLVPAIGVVAMLISAAVVFVMGPYGLVGLAGLALAFAFVIRLAPVLPHLFLVVLAPLLVGYAFFGRGFAYIGVPPVYVGEAVLGFGLVAAVLGGSLLVPFRSPVTWLLVAFAIWGAAQTVPYLETYGVDALRDAVVWGYGVFALIVAACVLSARRTSSASRWVSSIIRLFGKWTVFFVMAQPVMLALMQWARDFNLYLPGTEVAIFSVTPGASGVHLAGAAVFALLGLQRQSSTEPRGRHVGSPLFWGAWLISFVLVAALNRGGFLAIVVAVAVACTLDLFVGKRVVIAAGVGFAMAAAVLAVSVSLENTSELASSTEERAVSSRQVLGNIMSIGGVDSGGNLGDTRSWRLEWWQSIANYTIFGDYFWSGKGFGVNLADDDGFQVEYDETPLRSPHNGHMTVLARMGVPGLVLWVALQAGFGLSLAWAYVRARSVGAARWARINLWILCYWCAFLVSTTFDVFLEGPQGGIWFWCLMGFGIAVLECQRAELATAPADGDLA